MAVEGTSCRYAGEGPPSARQLVKALGFADADAGRGHRLLRLRPTKSSRSGRSRSIGISPGPTRRAGEGP